MPDQGPPTASVLAAYMVISNGGTCQITPHHPDFDHTELHRTIVESVSPGWSDRETWIAAGERFP
jgi:hypothetical protein